MKGTCRPRPMPRRSGCGGSRRAHYDAAICCGIPTVGGRAPAAGRSRRILRPLRRARSLPRDDKLNAGLNGLALSAFSQAIRLDPAYRRRADNLQRFLLTQLVRDRLLMKAMARGQILPQAELEDYAYVVQGLLDHAEATGNAQSRARAQQLALAACRRSGAGRAWQREARPLLATLQGASRRWPRCAVFAVRWC